MKIPEELVEIDPDKITSAVMDDNVNIGLIKQYFEEDAYLIVKDAGNKHFF